MQSNRHTPSICNRIGFRPSVWFGWQRQSSDALRQKLVSQRTQTSLSDRKLLELSDDVVEEHENWIRALVDYGHAVKHSDFDAVAFRALETRKGSLFWLVRRNGKTHGFHSDAVDPHDAIEEAQAAWQQRRRVRKDWPFVESLMRDVLLGRVKLTVRIEDAYASPLCAMGITAFLTRMRLGHVREISGRMAAVLMWIDPQVGFVLYEAYRREIRQLDGADGFAPDAISSATTPKPFNNPK